MFSHVMLGVNDMEKSKEFYDKTLAVLGIAAGQMDEKGRCFYISKSGVFALTRPIDGGAATHGNGSTIGFSASSGEQIDAWHAAGIANGGTTCESPPGVRPSHVGDIYLGYLRDPDGNKLCTLYRVPNK